VAFNIEFHGYLVGLSFTLSVGATTFYFRFGYFVDCSLEGAVFFLFFLFLPPDFYVDCIEFIAVAGRAVALVEGSTIILAM